MVFVTYTLIPFIIFGTLSLAIHAVVGIRNATSGVGNAVGRRAKSVGGFILGPITGEKGREHSD